jgi:hypothetical protein
MADKAPTAAKLPILYRAVTPVSREAHKGLRIRPMNEPLGFSRGTHAVPALIEEFQIAAREIPIVFVQEGDRVVPIFLVGIKQNVNSLVTAEGRWSISYIPAYVRRYPFVMADVEGGDSILCVDDTYEGLNKDEGELLLDDKGEPTTAMKGLIDFCESFRRSAQMTDKIMERLSGLKLFKPVSLDINSPKSGAAKIDGVLVVDDEKLKALPDDVTLELHKAGILNALQAHTMSLGATPALS